MRRRAVSGQVVTCFFSQAVSWRLVGRMVTTATRSFPWRQFRTAASASAVLSGVRVGCSNGVARSGTARLAWTGCDWGRGRRGDGRHGWGVVVWLVTVGTLRPRGRVGRLDLVLDQIPTVLGLVGGVVLVVLADKVL